MKLIKKQLSVSYVMKATASKSLNEQASPGGITKGDVANHRDYRLVRSSVANPQGKVEFTPQVSFVPPLGKGYEVHSRRLNKSYAQGPREAQPA